MTIRVFNDYLSLLSLHSQGIEDLLNQLGVISNSWVFFI